MMLSGYFETICFIYHIKHMYVIRMTLDGETKITNKNVLHLGVEKHHQKREKQSHQSYFHVS